MSDDPDDIDDEPLPTEQPSVDAGSPRAVRGRTRILKEQAKEAQRFWQGILSTETGRREMWALLNDLKAFEMTFACGPTGFPQPESTWFHAGTHAAGQGLYLKLATVDRAALLLMHDEHDPRLAKPKKDESHG